MTLPDQRSSVEPFDPYSVSWFVSRGTAMPARLMNPAFGAESSSTPWICVEDRAAAVAG
jgi:hypothetical protein